MTKRKINIRKILVPGDGLTIVIIIVGLLIAIFLPELAIRLIGVSVSILGAVALFLMISQRLKDYVGSIYTPSSKPAFTVSEIRDKDSVRQVFENFESTFANDDPIKSDEMNQKEFERAEEGFKIKKKDEEKKEQIKTQEEIKIQKPVKAEIPEDTVFGDEVSEFKIKSKSAKPEEQKTEPTQEQKTDSQIVPGFSPLDIDLSKESEKKADEKPIQPKQKVESTQTKEITEEPQITIKTKTEPPIETAKPSVQSTYDKPITQNFKQVNVDVTLSALVDNERVAGYEPKKEFEFFLLRVLKVVRSVTNTRTAAFFLVNHEKKQLILESIDSDIPDALTTRRKIPLKNDVISQIVLNVKPEILTEINTSAVTDLIPYYSRTVPVNSFIGVPVFYKNAVIGILCADSTIIEAYDAFTVGFMGHFTKLISALVESYTEKYELMQASKALGAISLFRHYTSLKAPSMQSLIDSIIESATKIFDFTTIGVVIYDEKVNNWCLKGYKTKVEGKELKIGTPVDLKNSLVGKIVLTGKTVNESNLTDNVVRVHPEEGKLLGGFFAGVPLKSITDIYGALFIEGFEKSGITAYDISVLETMAENAGVSIEHVMMMEVLQSSALFDNTTGIMNTNAFNQRIVEEIAKSKDMKTNLTLCLFKIDKYSSFDPSSYQERNEQIFQHVMKIAKQSLKPYYILGKSRGGNYGVLLPGLNLLEANKWAEKLRKDVARTFLEVDSKKFNVTISLGIAQADSKDNIESLLNNAEKALKISSAKTNSISLFE
ncbi:MAG: GAF domain-containing protein [Candidatus Kapabacteria bacterium]|nr:GAF domain-containing protein [Candidatus Kapabacteria bacterium]